MFTTNDLLIVIDMQNDFIDAPSAPKKQQPLLTPSPNASAATTAPFFIPSTPTATTISKPRKAIICPSRTV